MNLSISLLFQKAKNNIGKDVFFTLLNSLWKIISGPITLLMIPIFINQIVQGYWYTFMSLSALSIFADLGFTTIVSQFAAHEFAHLTIDKKSRLLVGDEERIQRISSLFRFVTQWGIKVSIFTFPIIFLVGYYMFANKQDDLNWILPWILFIAVSGINFTVGIVLSFLEGCNQIAEIQKNRTVSLIVSSLSVWLFLYLDFNLLALSLTSFIAIMINIIMLNFRFGILIRQILRKGKGYYVNWRKDFLRLLWKYAISWSSGYLIFQIYIPLTFQFHGSIDAGKVGLSMALTTAIFTISNVWMYVANPKLNMAASKKDWISMDRILRKNMILSILTFTICFSGVICLMILLKGRTHIIDRFLSIMPLSTLLICWMIQLIINSLALYLRAHKQEPLVYLSVMSASITTLSSYIIIRYFSVDYIFFGFLLAVIIGLPITISIFIKKRRLWHTQSI